MVSKMVESIVPETIADPTMKKIVPIAPIGIGASVDPLGYNADSYVYDLQSRQDIKEAQARDVATAIPVNESPEDKRKREGTARHKSRQTKPKMNLKKSKVIKGINTKIKAEIPRTSTIDFIMGKKTNNKVVMSGIDLNKINKSFGSPTNAIDIVGVKNKKVVVGIDVNRMKAAIKWPKVSIQKKRRIKVK